LLFALLQQACKQQFSIYKERNMIAFITSSPFREDVDRPTFSNKNQFVDRILDCLPENPRCLYICSSPDRPDLNCMFGADIFMAFAQAGVHFASYEVLDNRNAYRTKQLVEHSDLIVLAGGHLPTQNDFFRKIKLWKWLQDYSGVVMGISAGSMNCAKTVYVQPEEPGESAPEFKRFRPGLGLTKVQILPHYQKVKDYYLDGLRLFEDITYADSMDNTFFALPDGSYIIDDGEDVILFGEGYCLQDGVLEQIAEDGDEVEL
jgi:dipeptidase E